VHFERERKKMNNTRRVTKHQTAAIFVIKFESKSKIKKEVNLCIMIPFKRRLKSHLPFTGILGDACRKTPYQFRIE
jgi:hypothetical protein